MALYFEAVGWLPVRTFGATCHDPDGHSVGLPVLVEQGHVLAATFHPKLTDDETIHRYFLNK
jgi:glutamine amidotransferase PdxT